jgi:Dual specificity phosphatase, catalytic domain
MHSCMSVRSSGICCMHRAADQILLQWVRRIHSHIKCKSSWRHQDRHSLVNTNTELVNAHVPPLPPRCVNQQAGESVLVHCLAGASRSATIVMAAIMTKYGWQLDRAYDFVYAARNQVSVCPQPIDSAYESLLVVTFVVHKHISTCCLL